MTTVIIKGFYICSGTASSSNEQRAQTEKDEKREEEEGGEVMYVKNHGERERLK